LDQPTVFWAATQRWQALEGLGCWSGTHASPMRHWPGGGAWWQTAFEQLSTVQGLLSSQVSAWPWQVPATHWSLTVQGSLSVQALPTTQLTASAGVAVSTGVAVSAGVVSTGVVSAGVAVSWGDAVSLGNRASGSRTPSLSVVSPGGK